MKKTCFEAPCHQFQVVETPVIRVTFVTKPSPNHRQCRFPLCDALIELSKRAEQRGKKVVVKFMYDRANLKMITDSHLYVDEGEWTSDAVKMPMREEMPWVDFQLVNYHQ